MRTRGGAPLRAGARSRRRGRAASAVRARPRPIWPRPCRGRQPRLHSLSPYSQYISDIEIVRRHSVEWNAPTYDRVANPHVTWGRGVLDWLELEGSERVLDAGCGTGRVTELLLERL